MIKAAPQQTTMAAGCTCLRLRKAARRVSQIYDQYLAGTGLTITQFSLLGHIRAYDEIGIGALAEKLVMDASTLTRNLRPLERRELVAMKPDRADRRGRRLTLTRAGRDAFSAARPAWEQAQRHIAEAIGPGDGAALAVTIDNLLDRLAG